MHLSAIFCYGVYSNDGGCRYKFFGASFVGVANTNLGMIVRWANVGAIVEVVVVRGPMDM